MDTKQFLSNISNLFDSNPSITLYTNFRSIEGWDSMTALSLMAMLDDEYGVTISGAQIKTAVTVADLFNLVSKHGE